MQEPLPRHETYEHAPLRIPQFLTIGDCAKIMKVSYKTMWLMVRSDKGPPYVRPANAERWIRIRYEDFIRWVNANRKA